MDLDSTKILLLTYAIRALLVNAQIARLVPPLAQPAMWPIAITSLVQIVCSVPNLILFLLHHALLAVAPPLLVNWTYWAIV